MKFTNEEASLLMFLDTCAVDRAGKIDPRRLNRDDWGILERWETDKKLFCGRLPFEHVEKLAKSHYPATHWVVLSSEWVAHATHLREERTSRGKDCLAKIVGGRIWESHVT